MNEQETASNAQSAATARAAAGTSRSAHAVAVDGRVLERLIGHIRSGTTDMAPGEMRVPVQHFVSPEHARAEQALIKRLPLIVAHVSEIASPGDFITRDILGYPLLIVRRGDGSVATYRNMCRHRGGRVEQGASGHKRLFMCQYHGWSYEGDSGALKVVPYEKRYGDVDRECSGLIPIRTELRHGLIFVTLDGDAGPIAAYLGDEVDSQMAPSNLAAAQLYMEKTFRLPINWKLVMDGAIDSVHAQFLHSKPGGVGSRTVNNVAVFQDYGRHGRMFMARAKLKRLIEAGESLESSSNYVSSVLRLYPNSMMMGPPDHIEFWTVWPSLDNPSECVVQIRFFVRKEILGPEMEARIQKSWEILEQAALTEDFPMEQWIQQNAVAWPEGAFRYGANEPSTQHLHRQLAKDLADAGGTPA